MREDAVRKVWLLTLIVSLGFLQPHRLSASSLSERGYTLFPEPQQVVLKGGDFQFGSGWGLVLGPGVKASDAAVETLVQGLAKRYSLTLETGTRTRRGKVIELTVQLGSVQVGEAEDKNKAALREQAYTLELGSNRIRIMANAPQGLLYGVDTLVQLVRPVGEEMRLPAGTVTDWPNLETRFIYWDDRAHLDHIDVFKEAIRECAFYKINGIIIKLNGHFQFASAPAVVEPYALSPAELQDLTDYGLRYHVQIIPYLDGPAHVAWILKHPEYSSLRQFPDDNYELCSTNPDSYKLLEGMYQDLLNANKGVQSFVLSTDEPYYIGMANNAQCDEATRAKELGSVGKLLAEFITKAAGYLHDHGRTVFFWGEYPLKPGDISSLPSYLINNESFGPDFDPLFKAHGIQQMYYATYVEGKDMLFSSYYLLPPSQEYNYHPISQADETYYQPRRARIPAAFNEISFGRARQDADMIGVDVFGWGDNGLHPETFWLGNVTITGWGWHPVSPSPSEAESRFYELFYGRGAVNMDRVYQLMSTQAQFWKSSWDWMPSTSRNTMFGDYNVIFNPRRPTRDQTLPPLPVPHGEYLRLPYDWEQENAERVKMAQNFMPANDELLALLHKNQRAVQFHHYNLEVFLSIAGLYRQNLEMLQDLAQINDLLKVAQEAAAQVRFKEAVAALDGALDIAQEIRTQRNLSMQNAVNVWYKSWYPRVREASGRKILFVLNDVHDYPVDRALGLDYLIERELLLPLEEWFDLVEEVRNQYARAHGLGARTDKLDWKQTAGGAGLSGN